MIPVRFLLVGCLVTLSMFPGTVARAQEMPLGYKSPERAFLLSFLGTAAPLTAAVLTYTGSGDESGSWLLGLGGAVVGPSMGHFYAGRPGRAWRGIGVRILAVGGLIVAFDQAWDSDDGSADALALTSLTVGSVMGVYDIVTAPGSARAHNEEQQVGRVMVRPALLGDARVPGIRVDLAF